MNFLGGLGAARAPGHGRFFMSLLEAKKPTLTKGTRAPGRGHNKKLDISSFQAGTFTP